MSRLCWVFGCLVRRLEQYILQSLDLCIVDVLTVVLALDTEQMCVSCAYKAAAAADVGLT